MNTIAKLFKTNTDKLKSTISVLFMTGLLVACDQSVEQAPINEMKFTVPGGEPLLRAVDVSTIEARCTVHVSGENARSNSMSRVAGTDQWQCPSVVVPKGATFKLTISWSAIGVDGFRVLYAMQTYEGRAVFDETISVSNSPILFELYDYDRDFANNYEELLAGTPPMEPASGNSTDIRVYVELEVVNTVPPAAANSDESLGYGEVFVNTSTGAITGSGVTIGTPDNMPTAAHIHRGFVGETGEVLIVLELNSSGAWFVPDGAALDAAGIEAFLARELYINVHTPANPTGELRGQI